MWECAWDVFKQHFILDFKVVALKKGGELVYFSLVRFYLLNNFQLTEEGQDNYETNVV